MVLAREPQYFEIGSVARRLGVATETIRSWERRNMTALPRRTATGTRLYTEKDVEVLREVRDARHSAPRSLDAA